MNKNGQLPEKVFFCLIVSNNKWGKFGLNSTQTQKGVSKLGQRGS